jgi:hypothetical protein
MRNPWLEILDRILRPARPDLGRCIAMRELHLAAWRPFSDGLVRAMTNCEQRINDARAVVFAADDGVVGGRMTLLEREWRTLMRRNSEAGAMDLWARIAPPTWIDRKRWRDSAAPLQLDAMIALASDVAGVEAAERATANVRPGASVRWRLLEKDAETATDLLAEPLREATDAIRPAHRPRITERLRRLERRVHWTARTRFHDRPGLSRDISHAAFVDGMWRVAFGIPNPRVRALGDLWKTGYAISEMTGAWVTLEIPPL